MDESWNEGPQVVISFMLPEPLYAWIEYAASQKGVTVSALVREWVIQSVAPWKYDPLPLDAHTVDEGPHREEYGRQTTKKPKELPDHIKRPAERILDCP